jgi:hypothetical protein
MAATNMRARNDEIREVFSRPQSIVKHTFQTQQTQYIEKRALDGVDRCLYYFAGHFIARGMKEEELEIAQARVIDGFSAFINEADEEILRLNEAMKQTGVVKAPKIEYSKVEDKSVKFSNPLSLRFLAVLTKLDELCRSVDAAWMVGAIGPGQRSRALFSYRNKVRAMGAELRRDKSVIDRRVSQEWATREAERVAEREKRILARKKSTTAKVDNSIAVDVKEKLKAESVGAKTSIVSADAGKSAEIEVKAASM